MNKILLFSFISLFFITGCTNQPKLFSGKSYHGAPYSLESIAYEYNQQKVTNE